MPLTLVLSFDLMTSLIVNFCTHRCRGDFTTPLPIFH